MINLPVIRTEVFVCVLYWFFIDLVLFDYELQLVLDCLRIVSMWLVADY
jgi:hypothetical protein